MVGRPGRKKKEWAEAKEEEMKGKKDTRPTYEKKGFPAALSHFLAEVCPPLRGELIREPVVREICSLVEQYYPATERMKMGQVLWYAVDKDEKAGYGKRIEDCKLRPVIVDLITESDIEDVLRGMAKRERQKKVTVRLFEQAFEQSGVFTNADVAAIMRLAPGTVSRYVREVEKERGELVPRRGTVHDLGPSVTHKHIICEKHLKEGKTIEKTAEETYHSPQAVRRYVNDFKRVSVCLKSGWKVQKIAYATGLSTRLTQEYVDMMMKEEVPF